MSNAHACIYGKIHVVYTLYARAARQRVVYSETGTGVSFKVAQKAFLSLVFYDIQRHSNEYGINVCFITSKRWLITFLKQQRFYFLKLDLGNISFHSFFSKF